MPGLGTLTVYLNANSTGLERGIASATSMLKKFAAGAAAYLGANALKDQIHESLSLMSVQEQAERALSRTLAASTKTINGSAGQLKQWAADMQSVSTFGDEKLIQAQTRLLEMNSVAGEAFDRARAAAVDIAAQKGEDVTAVMQKLGMAMQDPLKAFKQLRDYGVDQSLRQEVEARIAAGDKEAAQIILLTDLQKRYAGAAEEAADTYTGRLTQVQNAVGDLKEAIGYVIEEIFGVKDGLKSTADTIGEWATALRMRAREIGFAFRSVWTDIQAGANQLWILLRPVFDVINEAVTTATDNIRSLLSGDFTIKVPDFSKLGSSLAKVGDRFDQVERERQRAQDELLRELSDKEDRARKEDAAKSAGSMKKAVEEGVVAADQKIKTGAVAAELGSNDAWKIITAAALAGKASGSSAAVQNAAKSAGIDLTPAVTQGKTNYNTAFGFVVGDTFELGSRMIDMKKVAKKAVETAGKNTIERRAVMGGPEDFAALEAFNAVNPNPSRPSEWGAVGEWLGKIFGTMKNVERNTAAAVPKPANLRR